MLHKNITLGDQHFLQQWEPANAAARTALVVTASDVGKVARQLDTNVFYLLMDDSPMTWADISTAGGAGTVTSVTSANADATVATTTTTPVITIVQAPALRSASTTVDVSSATAPTNGQVLTATSGTAATWQTPSAGGGITLGTPQASTSGTSIDFTSIPAGVKEISISFAGVSTTGADVILIQLGDSGGIETTSYNGTGSGFATGVGTTSYTSGFGITNSSASGNIFYGHMTLRLENSSNNTWSALGFFSYPNFPAGGISGGVKSLSATLDRVRITTTGGTDTFDAGEINIQYQS